MVTPGMWLSPEDGVLMNGIVTLVKEDQGSPFAHHARTEVSDISEPGSGPPDTESAGALCLPFLVWRAMRNERLLFINCPGVDILSRQLEWTQTPPQVAAAIPRDFVRGTKIGVHLHMFMFLLHVARFRGTGDEGVQVVA